MKRTTGYIIMAAAVIFTGWLFSRAWIKSHEKNETINVTGLATHDFVSDLIVWNGSFSRKSMNMQEAYAMLKTDADAIKKYLLSKGVTENEIVFSAVDIHKDFEDRSQDPGGINRKELNTKVFTGYILTQHVQVESKSVDRTEAISREVTGLIDAGVELSSSAPQYYYTKLSSLKKEMLAAAAKDARERADNIAANAGSKVGDLKSADMGIFQITAQNSSEDYTWGGAFNTSSKRKTASITVKLEFDID
jgi:hypothetical protein